MLQNRFEKQVLSKMPKADRKTIKNPNFCSEYANEIHKHMMALESSTVPPSGYMKK